MIRTVLTLIAACSMLLVLGGCDSTADDAPKGGALRPPAETKRPAPSPGGTAEATEDPSAAGSAAGGTRAGDGGGGE